MPGCFQSTLRVQRGFVSRDPETVHKRQLRSYRVTFVQGQKVESRVGFFHLAQALVSAVLVGTNLPLTCTLISSNTKRK